MATTFSTTSMPSPVVASGSAEILARMERLPLSSWHLKARAIVGSATFFDGIDYVAIGMVLTAVERAQSLAPRTDSRPKITHCTLINDDLVRRIKATGTVPALFTTYAYYNSDKFGFYGEEMMKRCMAFRTLLDAGVPVAAGSDFQPGPFDPRMAIQGMVTRTGWDGKTWGANQRISVDEALRVNTLNGAYNSHEEAIKGSITPGKLADFVVLAEDLHTMDAGKIKDVAIVRTVVGGATVYQA